MTDELSIPFRGFDERCDALIYHHGVLPHLRQDGCTYFVTFRLADSLPAAVAREIRHERTLWLKSRGIAIADDANKLEFPNSEVRDEYQLRFSRRLNDLLDAGHGRCILAEEAAGRIVEQALLFFDPERVRIGDYVIMPNHVHALMTPVALFDLSELLQSIKSFSANELNRLCGTSGRVWQRESYDHIVRDFDELEVFQQYIASNPRMAGLNPASVISGTANYHPGA